MIDWHATNHHYGWFTFDWCDRQGCEDPTHTAPEEGPEREAAEEESKKLEAIKAEKRLPQ